MNFYQVYFAEVSFTGVIKIGVTSLYLSERIEGRKAYDGNTMRLLFALPVRNERAEKWFLDWFRINKRKKLVHGREWFANIHPSEIMNAIQRYQKLQRRKPVKPIGKYGYDLSSIVRKSA